MVLEVYNTSEQSLTLRLQVERCDSSILFYGATSKYLGVIESGKKLEHKFGFIGVRSGKHTIRNVYILVEETSTKVLATKHYWSNEAVQVFIL